MVLKAGWVMWMMHDSGKQSSLLWWRRSIVGFYLDGFRSMTVGRTLWTVIVIKLLVIFAFLKVFFFSDYLRTNFSTDQQRAEHVLEQITLQKDGRGNEGL